MPIKVSCKCGASFGAKDELAGKAVKCPKCGQALRIPGGKAAQPKPAAPQPSSPSATSMSSLGTGGPSLGGLLDEIGLAPVTPTKGPKCPSCNAPVTPGAVICVECGFNSQTGEKMETEINQDPEANLSSAEKMVAKAQRAMDENPDINAGGYGDEGIAAYLLTFGAAAGVMMIVIWISIMGIFVSPTILYIMSAVVSFISLVWVIIIAFQESPLQGVLTLCICPFYALIYSVIRLQKAKIPLALYFLSICMGVCGYIVQLQAAAEQQGHLLEAVQTMVALLG